MRSGAAAGHRGYFHQAALYGSQDEFVSIVVPFLEGAVQAGEPAVVALDEDYEQLICTAMPDTSRLSFVDGDVRYTRPASTIKAYRKLLAEHTARGAQQIRFVGNVPHSGVGSSWEPWARYEAAINHAYDDYPLWGLCPYDTRTTAADVLADVARTHPYTTAANGQHLANDRFEDPAGFLVRRPPPTPDPLQAAPPVMDLVDPTPAAARRAVLAVPTSGLDATEVDDLAYSVSEAITNGICHGRPPVRLLLWAAADRIVATVTDRGAGPSDPFVGLLPATDTTSAGLGLWLAHQLCSHVTFGRTDDGFTVRLTAGATQP